jgi:hypothetical protein
MDNPTVIAFAKGFDPTDRTHVTWWKMLCDNMHGDPSRIAKLNPMKVEFTDRNVLDLVFIQFSIGLKYAMATLDGASWSPAFGHTPGG